MIHSHPTTNLFGWSVCVKKNSNEKKEKSEKAKNKQRKAFFCSLPIDETKYRQIDQYSKLNKGYTLKMGVRNA